jgi:F0F1-type ATP synthase delta subunit
MLRELDELLRAGKLDEVLEPAARIREVAKNNPRIMNLIDRAMAERKSKPDAAQSTAGTLALSHTEKFPQQ